MEQKLAEYRIKKRLTSMSEPHTEHPQEKSYFKKWFSRNQKIEEESTVELLPEEPQDLEESCQQYSFEEPEAFLTTKNVLYYLLCVAFWATLFAIFVKLEFGTVYFVVSLLVIICLNTRTRPKKPNEPSAYSVFNKNCESIDGTLKAEQFEKEMIYGFGAVH